MLLFLGVSVDLGGFLSSLLSGLANVFIGFVSYLLNEVNNLINWLVSLIPPLPSWPSGAPSIASAVSFVLNLLAPYMYAWNYYVALNLAIVLFVTMLGAEATLAAWHFVRWLLTHLPFGLGGGE
jgi:hypothetical protein